MPDKPNIVLVMSDEQSWDTMGANGNPAAQTPHLDALAARGTTFDGCYTTYPLCCPARASLWTGLMPRHHHVVGNWRSIRPRLRDGGVSDFAAAGYHTIYTGKWHVPGTTPERQGFRDASAIPAILGGRDRGRYIKEYREYAAARGYELSPDSMENLTESDLATLQEKGPRYGTSAIPAEHFLETWQTTRFLQALERRPDDRPFFAVCSYNAPHFPMVVPEPYDRLVPPDSINLPPNFCAGREGKPDEVMESRYYTDQRDLDEDQWRSIIAHYLGLCSLVDAQVGRIVGYLRDRDELQNTVLVFTSDHGDMMGAHGLMKKGHELHYEEALRVPLVLSHPDSQGGRRFSGLVSLMDLLPSLAEFAGVTPRAETDGVSFADHLAAGSPRPTREYVTAESFLFGGAQNGNGDYVDPGDFDGTTDSVNLSIRTKHWRYVFRWNDHDELYDLVLDPYELRNLAGAAARAQTVRWMRQMLAEEVRDDLPEVAGRLTRDPN